MARLEYRCVRLLNTVTNLTRVSLRKHYLMHRLFVERDAARGAGERSVSYLLLLLRR